jgi:hypothetical protein
MIAMNNEQRIMNKGGAGDYSLFIIIIWRE